MATTSQSSIENDHVRPVNEAVQEYRILEDGALAHYLQEREIEHHYSCNVEQRRTVMGDIVAAKKLQDEEDQDARILTMDQQEQIKELDERLAGVMQEELVQKHLIEEKEMKEREKRDQETALMIMERDRRRDMVRNVKDHRLAQRLSEQELKEQNRIKNMSDEELAKRLQHEEKLRLRRQEEKRNNLKAVVELQDEELAKFIHEREVEEAEMMYHQEQRRRKGKKKTRMPPGDPQQDYYPDDLPNNHLRHKDQERPGPSSRNQPLEEPRTNDKRHSHHNSRSCESNDPRYREHHEVRTPEKNRSSDHRKHPREDHRGVRTPQRPPPPRERTEESPSTRRERASDSPVFERRRNAEKERQQQASDRPTRRTNSGKPHRPPPPQNQPEQLIDRMPAHFVEPLEGEQDCRVPSSGSYYRTESQDNLQNDEDLEYGEGFSRLTKQEAWYNERHQQPLQRKKSKGDCKQQ